MKVTPRQWTIELNEDERDELLGILKKFENHCTHTISTTGAFIDGLIEELR